MAVIRDGPASSHFRPLPLKGKASVSALRSASDTGALPNLSAEMVAALEHAPTEACVFWGIPFEIGEVILPATPPSCSADL